MKLTSSKLEKIIKEEMSKAKEVLSLNSENVQSVKEEIENALLKMVPWSKVRVDTLGGKERPSIMFNISLDPKEDWQNGIYQNSRFAQFSLSYNGRAEQFSGGSRRQKWSMRSGKVKNVQDLLKKLQKFVDVGQNIKKI